MKHDSFARGLSLVVAATMAMALTGTSMAQSGRSAQPGQTSSAVKTVKLSLAPTKPPVVAPAPAPAAPVDHDGDRFRYDSCGCSGGQ